MSNDKYSPVLEKVPHAYPFLRHSVFHWETEKFDPDRIKTLIAAFVYQYIEKNIADGKADATLKMFMQGLQDGSGSDFFGTDTLDSVGHILSFEKEATIDISCLNIRFVMRRFGDCVGIRPVDNSGNPHKQANEILEAMASAVDTAKNFLAPFIYKWSIAVPRWQRFKNNHIDVITELGLLKEYIPNVNWFASDSQRITNLLCENYINGFSGVPIGSYHDIPIRMQIVYGDEKKDWVWRRGTVECSVRGLKFSSNQSDNLRLVYSFRIADEAKVLHDYNATIDRATEQFCLERLATVLMHGLEAQYLEETIVENPLFVAWKRALPGN